MSPPLRPPPPDDTDRRDIEAWAAAGMPWLTGPADGAGLGPPAGFVGRLTAITDRIADASSAVGHRVEVDGLAALAARAAIGGLRRRGQVSCGGATHLVEALDGWLAVSLARPDDVDLLPAWLGADPATTGLGTDPGLDPADPWPWVEDRCRGRAVADVVDRGILLGLPVAALDDRRDGPRPPLGCTTVLRETAARPPSGRPPLVVDLGALWAGPLCGSIFARVGATVTKVESTTRPDGARSGPAAFFDLLNAGKQGAAFDLRAPAGRAALADLLAWADVVIEASRPRALHQLGIDPLALLAAADGPRVWVSITGHGRGAGADRVAFGDDAAVAGGLVAWDGDRPCFCGDAVADPLSGLAAAALGLEAWASGATCLVEVAMADVARHVAGPTLDATGVRTVPPTVPVVEGHGPPLGGAPGDDPSRDGHGDAHQLRGRPWPGRVGR